MKVIKYAFLIFICAHIITGCSNGSSLNNSYNSSNLSNEKVDKKQLEVIGHYVYTTSFDQNIRSCEIDESTGDFVNCNITSLNIGGQATGVAIAPDHRSIYVASSNRTVYRCYVFDNGIPTGNCTGYVSSSITSPTFMAVNKISKNLYIANEKNNTVTVCTIEDDDDSLHNCTRAGAGFLNPRGITISSDGKHAYIANRMVNAISVCGIQEDRTLYGCDLYSEQNTSVELSGIIVHPTYDYLYAADLSSSSALKFCDIVTYGSVVGTCNPLTAPNSAPVVPGGDDLALDSSGRYLYITVPYELYIVKVELFEGQPSTPSIIPDSESNIADAITVS